MDLSEKQKESIRGIPYFKVIQIPLDTGILTIFRPEGIDKGIELARRLKTIREAIYKNDESSYSFLSYAFPSLNKELTERGKNPVSDKEAQSLYQKIKDLFADEDETIEGIKSELYIRFEKY